jgi:hypothetical protein
MLRLNKLNFTIAALAMLAICQPVFAQKVVIRPEAAKSKYTGSIKIEPMDGGVKIEKNKITFAPKKEGKTYLISGYFNGQLINKTKNTVLKLNNAFLENQNGQSTIYGEAKIELSSTEGSVNYIVISGSNEKKVAAVHSKKNLELGGSGTVYVKGDTYHAVKGDDVKLKGSGTWYLQSTKEGSGINCKNFIVEKDKSFNAWIIESKNAIKADFTIKIESGNFFMFNNATALKTDTKKDDPKSPHFILLNGGKFTVSGFSTLYKTEKDAFKNKGAKIIESIE